MDARLPAGYDRIESLAVVTPGGGARSARCDDRRRTLSGLGDDCHRRAAFFFPLAQSIQCKSNRRRVAQLLGESKAAMDAEGWRCEERAKGGVQ